jgi:DNA mismatch repair ATPase MutS
MNDDTSALEIDDQGRTSAGARRLSEWTDTPVTGFPKVETRHLPFMERLRLRWLGQIPRGARR